MATEILDKLDRFREKALARGVPPGDVERWLGAARRCATLSPSGDGPVVGHLGGPVMLPADFPDPFEGGHLIASLELAALPEDATGLPLPPDGRLLLFADPDYLAGYSVSLGDAVYIPAGTPVEERQVAADAEDTFPELAAELHGELRLKYDVSLPDHDTIIDAVEHPRAGELREVGAELRREEMEIARWPPQLRIDGYATDEYGEWDPVTSSAAWSAASEEEGLRPGSGERTRPEDWVLLAQWDPHIYGMEGATVHWAIRRQDIAARRFDRVYVTMFFAP